MKFSQTFLVIALSLITAFATTSYFAGKNTSKQATESAYDRVLRTNTLRCGYYIFPPMTMRDPNTNVLSGLSVDIVEAIAKNAGLKVDWAEEVDFGNWPATLKAGRVDAICGPLWPDTALAREVLFTRPMFYAGINAYARSDDHRFDGNLAAINDPSVTIAAIEGNAIQFLAQTLFPKAKIQSVPQNAPGGSVAENVITKKADIFLWDENGVFDFLKSNPGSIHNIDPAHPVKVMPFELPVSINEPKLRNILDTGLQNLEDAGITNQLLDKWERTPNAFYRMTKPYSTK